LQNKELTASSRRARLTLGLALFLGVGYILYRLTVTPGQFGIDFGIYRAAAADLQMGQEVYDRSPVGVSNLTYRYPIVLLAAFSLYLLVPPVVGFALHLAGTILVSVILGLAIVRVTELHGVRLSNLDRGLICAFITIGPISAPSLVFGNINHYIALCLGLGLIWLERDQHKRAGVALGLAALPKVFPAAIGIWLLWRRKWYATFVAAATGIGALAAGVVLFGWIHTHRYFVAELLPRGTANAASGSLSPSSLYVTLQRPLTAMFADASGVVLTVLALIIVAPVVAYAFLYSEGPVERLIALLTTLCAILLVIPSYTMYFVLLSYPLVPLLYLLSGWPGRIFTGGVVLMQFTLKLHDANLLVRLLSLPPWGNEVMLGGLRAFYTLGTPVLWGTVAVLIAGLWQIHSS
jgi:hypothetical protein